MGMTVDEPRSGEPTLKIDHPGVRPDRRLPLLSRPVADIDDAFACNGHCAGPRLPILRRVNPPVNQREVSLASIRAALRHGACGRQRQYQKSEPLASD